MALNTVQQWLQSVLGPYRDRHITYSDVDRTLQTYPSLSPRTDTYTYDDGRTVLLLTLQGTVPISFRQATYNIPVAVWLPHTFPQDPPIVYVTPTSEMLVRPSQNVQISGLCQGEYMESWQRKSEGRNLVDLLQALQGIFSREPPLYAKPPPSAQQIRPQPSPSPSSPVNNGQRYAFARPPPQPPQATSNPAMPALPAKPMSAVAQGKSPLRCSDSLSAPGQVRPLSAQQLDPSPYAQPSRLQSPTHIASPAYYPPDDRQNPQRSQSLTAHVIQQSHKPLLSHEQQQSHAGPSMQPTPQQYYPQDLQLNGAASPSVNVQQAQVAQSPLDSPVSSPPPNRPTRPAGLYQASAATSKAAAQQSMSTPVNILDQDDSPSHILRRDGSDAAPTPPRPVNPELLNLRRAMYAHITYHQDALRAHLNADNQSLAILHADLLKGEPAIRDEMARLVAVRDVCANVRDRLKAIVQETEQRTGELSARDLPEVDELVCGTNIVHNQLLELIAEDNAHEDTIYQLGRAFNMDAREPAELERFLKRTRILAREQFMRRSLINKILLELAMARANQG